MSHETLPTIDELNRMNDLSGAALYRAEVQRIPFLTHEEQPTYIEAARVGDEAAQHALVLNCLNWVRYRAWAIHTDREPQHTDVMNLVGTTNLRMLEAVPNALAANDPITYLMRVGSNAMRWQIPYHDPAALSGDKMRASHDGAAGRLGPTCAGNYHHSRPSIRL